MYIALSSPAWWSCKGDPLTKLWSLTFYMCSFISFLVFASRCRIHGVAFEVSLFSPIVALLAANAIIYCCVLRRLYLSRNIRRSRTGSRQSAVKLAVVRSMAFASLLGLTWITGLFMFDNASVSVQYLFTIAVSLQGLSIFLLQCVANSDTRKRWSAAFVRMRHYTQRHSSAMSDSELSTTHSASSVSENTLATPGTKRSLRVFSSKPIFTKTSLSDEVFENTALKSQMSPVSCEVLKNTSIREFYNPVFGFSEEAKENTPPGVVSSGNDGSFAIYPSEGEQ